jgi:excisionase family DNA binding protein
MSDTLLTVKETAARLALGRSTVYELIARRELKTIKIGRARRVPESAVEEWIAQQVQVQEGEIELAIDRLRAESRNG